MAKYAIDCSCGHTTTLEASTKDEAIEQALDLAPSHIEEFHKDLPDYQQLKAMSREELAKAMRPQARLLETEPAFRETLDDEEI